MSQTDFFRANEVTPEVEKEIEECFTYAPWDGVKAAKGGAVRKALVDAIKVIIANVPSSPTRTVAIRKLIEARMDCNAAITHNGKF